MIQSRFHCWWGILLLVVSCSDFGVSGWMIPPLTTPSFSQSMNPSSPSLQTRRKEFTQKLDHPYRPQQRPRRPWVQAATSALIGFGLMGMILGVWTPLPGYAVSGGGLDYAGIDISGQDFANGNYKGKDFTQVIAKATKFSNSNLQGCRFYKAYLVKADFSGADLRGASLEDTSMDEANFRNAIAVGSYFSSSILDASNLENVDFTDAQFPLKTLPLLCDRVDVKGVNPVTGADTRESLMCP